MNILIYVPELKKEAGGVYQYTFGVFNNIKDIQEYSYYIFIENSFTELEKFVLKNKNFIILPKKDCNIGNKWTRVLVDIKRITNKILNYYGFKFRFNAYSYFKRVTQKHKIDIVYSPNQNIPESKLPLIVTTHDVQQLHFPNYFNIKERIGRAVTFKLANNDAAKIIVSYEHIKSDINRFLKRKKDDIHVLLLAMNNLWFKDYVPKDYVDLSKYKLPEKFILYPAATWEHKNHIRLIKSVSKLKKEGVIVNVVCTGNKTSFFSKIMEELKINNVQNLFHFLGIVDDKVLYTLYKTCRATVIPTVYEAGSFPLIESIFLGTPAICSNVTSLPETIGNNDYVFNPFDINQIADKVRLIYTNNKYLQSNKTHLLAQKERLINTGFKVKFKNIISTFKK